MTPDRLYKSRHATTKQLRVSYSRIEHIGRLYQVEYAMEAISHASTALGILAKDGLVIAAEKKVASKLLDETKGGEKIYIINE